MNYSIEPGGRYHWIVKQDDFAIVGNVYEDDNYRYELWIPGNRVKVFETLDAVMEYLKTL